MKRFLILFGMVIMLLALLCVPAYAAGGNGSGGGNGRTNCLTILIFLSVCIGGMHTGLLKTINYIG